MRPELSSDDRRVICGGALRCPDIGSCGHAGPHVPEKYENLGYSCDEREIKCQVPFLVRCVPIASVSEETLTQIRVKRAAGGMK